MSTYDLVDPGEDLGGTRPDSSAYRRTHYRVYDEDGFSSAFGTEPPEGATLASVSAAIVAAFHGRGATGYGSKDLVVMFGRRIVLVVRAGPDGEPVVTSFDP